MREKTAKLTLLFLVLVFALQCLTLRSVRATYREVLTQMSEQAPHMETQSIYIIQVLDLLKAEAEGVDTP